MAAVAHTTSSHDVHPLLRHPRPVKGDYAKAQRMLGLVVDSEERATTLHRERSRTTKWLERPLYAHLDVSGVELNLDAEGETKKTGHDGKNDGYTDHIGRPVQELAASTQPVYIEPKSKVDTSFSRRRPEPLKNLRPISYHSQHLLTPEWTASPASISPGTQCPRPSSMQFTSTHVRHESTSSFSSLASSPRAVHPQTWPVQINDSSSSIANPPCLEQRPRPMSFATYQHRDRRNSKIASSRGLRNNSYPNFSLPNQGSAPKAIPGESIEGDLPYNRFADIGVGPPSPSYPVQVQAASVDFDNIVDNLADKGKDEKKKKRWTAIPQTLKKFTRRRSSVSEAPKPVMDVDELRRMNLTEQNLRWYESQPSHDTVPPGSAVKPLPTPIYSPAQARHTTFERPLPTPTSSTGVPILTPTSPNEARHAMFEAPLPKPFAPWAEAPPSPALSQDKRRSIDMFLSPIRRRRASSRLSVENVIAPRPESQHSRGSSSAMLSPVRPMEPAQPQIMFDSTPSPRMSRRGTPVVDRSCILCKTTKEPAAFVSHRISGNCWHEPASCNQCLQAHIEKCVATQGWERCTCPECGEIMTYEDMAAFADEDDSFVKWED